MLMTLHCSKELARSALEKHIPTLEKKLEEAKKASSDDAPQSRRKIFVRPCLIDFGETLVMIIHFQT